MENAFDILDRVTNTVYRSGAGTAVRSFAYAYDPDGLLTQKVAVAGDGTAVTNVYAYDALCCLVSADGVSYSYDLAGNRLSQGDTGVSPVQHTYTHNRLDGDLYNAAGCVTNMVRNGVTLALSWNTQGQLITVSTNGAFAESYQYDALGRRVATTDNGGTVFHLYDGNQCVADTDANGNPLRTYAWGPGIDNLLAVTGIASGATNTYYAVKDRLGSVCALADAAGAVAESYTYDAWGNVQSAVGNAQSAVGNRYLFQCREYSAATGLYNFRARWYDPTFGRWLSKDPIGLEGGLNLYAFCGDDPVNYVDCFGLDRWVVDFCHAFIVVQTWSPDGKSTGYVAISFGPSGVSIEPWPFAPPSNPFYSQRITSTPEEDKILLETAEDLWALPWYKFPYNLLTFNCRHFTAVMRNAGLANNGNPSLTAYIPLCPPVILP